MYRVDCGSAHEGVALSIGVQKMVRSDLGAAGVLFMLDTERGFLDVVLINSSYALGESVVKGRVDPDKFLVFKPTLRLGYKPIIKRSLGRKEEKLVYATPSGRSTRAVHVPKEDRTRFSLTDEDVLTIAWWACLIEDHYSAQAGRLLPMDLEWAKGGHTGNLFVLQARPETVHALARQVNLLDEYRLGSRDEVLLRGRALGQKIGSGPVRVIRDVDELRAFAPGEVLVADMTDPDWTPTMKMGAAIVTSRAGRTCHAAIVSRELVLPCVVDTERDCGAAHWPADDRFLHRGRARAGVRGTDSLLLRAHRPGRWPGRAPRVQHISPLVQDSMLCPTCSKHTCERTCSAPGSESPSVSATGRYRPTCTITSRPGSSSPELMHGRHSKGCPVALH